MKFSKAVKERLKKQTPRWFVFLVDIHSTIMSFIVALAIVWQSDWNIGLKNSAIIACVAFLVYPLSYLFFKTYMGIIRHTGLRDIVNVLKASSFALLLLLIVLYTIDSPYPKESFTLVVLHYLLTTSFLVFLRILYKHIILLFIQLHSDTSHLFIYIAVTTWNIRWIVV